MSTRRRRIRRQTIHLGPSPREKFVAALGAVGVVVFTVFAVWALRPGGFHPAGLSGGIANRQAKATLLVVGTFALLAWAIWYFWNRAREGRPAARSAAPVVVGSILVVAVAAGFVWPDGLLYHYDPPEPIVETPEDIPLPQQTTPTTAAPTTSAAPTTAAPTTAAATSAAPPTTVAETPSTEG